MELIANFRADWVEHMRTRLKEKGFKVKASATDDQLSCTYWNTIWRHIPVQPRKVVRAKELVCPPERQAGLEALAKRFEAGEDVNPWLSTTRKIGHFNDKLLNDWGIQHFHLGLTPEERFDDCLFATVISDGVFFLHVLPHDRYTERDLVRRMHSNWPKLLEDRRVVGIDGPDLTDEEVQTIRNKNGNVALKMPDGVTYFPPGGGLVSSGLAIGVRRNADFAMEAVEDYQKHVETNLRSIAEQFGQQGRPIQPPANFKLHVDEPGHVAWAVEVNSKAKFKLGPLLRPSTQEPIQFA